MCLVYSKFHALLQGLVNVLIEHHPTKKGIYVDAWNLQRIRDTMMFKVSKMGHLRVPSRVLWLQVIPPIWDFFRSQLPVAFPNLLQERMAPPQSPAARFMKEFTHHALLAVSRDSVGFRENLEKHQQKPLSLFLLFPETHILFFVQFFLVWVSSHEKHVSF